MHKTYLHKVDSIIWCERKTNTYNQQNLSKSGNCELYTNRFTVKWFLMQKFWR